MAARQEILTCVETWSSLALLSFSSALIIILYISAEKSLEVLKTETRAQQARAGGELGLEWEDAEPQREKLQNPDEPWYEEAQLTGLSY